LTPQAVGRDIEVPLQEAVAQWQRRRDTVREFLAGLTDQEFQSARRNACPPGYPQVRDFPLAEAVFIGVSETVGAPRLRHA
jgi:hypothetical protein